LDAATVGVFLQKLQTAMEKYHCLVLVYCFMPEHLHLIVRGQNDQADSWQAMVQFKQQTGFWLSQQRSKVEWQKDFYDHIIRADEDLGAQIRYVMNNPVRRGLVVRWQDYPFTGAIGVSLHSVAEGTQTL